MEFLLHKKFGRAIFFSYREFSLTRSSLIGSFDCTSKGKILLQNQEGDK